MPAGAHGFISKTGEMYGENCPIPAESFVTEYAIASTAAQTYRNLTLGTIFTAYRAPCLSPPD